MAPASSTYGGLKLWQWGLVGAGGLGVFVLYRRSRASAAASQGLAGGSTIPTVVQATGTSTNPNTLPQWIQAAVSQLSNATSYSPSMISNDITAWLQGNCVSDQGAKALGGLIGTLGVPPGYTTLPTLTACAATPAPPPPTPAPNPGPGPAPAPPPAPGPVPTATNAPQLVTLEDGKQYYALGNLSSTGTYTGYKVSGGFPVLATYLGQGIPQIINSFTNPFGLTLDVFTPADTPLSSIGNYGTEQLGGGQPGNPYSNKEATKGVAA